MAVVKNLMVRAGADFSSIYKETRKAQQNLANFNSKVSSTMGKIKNTLIALGIGKVIKDAVGSAMTVESSINQIGRTMGANAQEFQNWVKTQAGGYGLATSEALKYGATFSNLVSSFSKDTTETTKRTEELLKASAIAGSATGRTMEDTMDRIRSGLLGNTESIEDLGVFVNVAMLESTEAFKKFANGKSWQQLDFQTQQQIRLMAILEQINTKYGNTLANTTATKQQMFVASLKNAQLALGQAFLPIYNVVLPALTAMVNAITSVLNVIAQFSQALFGSNTQNSQKTTQGTQKQASAVTKLGDATEKAGKQAKGALAGFDEVHNLMEDNDSGTEGINPEGLATGQPVNLDIEANTGGISPQIQAFADNIKAKFKEVTDSILSNKEIIISALGGIIAGFVAFETLTFLATLPTIIGGIGAALTALLSPIALVSAAIGALVGAFLYLYQTNADFRNKINAVWEEICNIFSSILNDTLIPILNDIVNDFLIPLGKAFEDNILPILADIFVGIGEIFADILRLIQSTIDNVWGILKPGMDLVKNIIIDVLEIIKQLWDKYGQDLIENIKKFIKGVQETFQLLWDNVLNPIIKPFLEMLSWLWDKHLKALVLQIGEFVMKCVNGALELYNGFIKPLIDWMVVEFGPAIANTINFVIDIFGTMLLEYVM